MTSWKILSESVSFENIENVAIAYLVDDVSILQSCEKHVSFTVKFEYVMIFDQTEIKNCPFLVY